MCGTGRALRLLRMWLLLREKPHAHPGSPPVPRCAKGCSAHRDERSPDEAAVTPPALVPFTSEPARRQAGRACCCGLVLTGPILSCRLTPRDAVELIRKTRQQQAPKATSQHEHKSCLSRTLRHTEHFRSSHACINDLAARGFPTSCDDFASQGASHTAEILGMKRLRLLAAAACYC